MKTIFVKTRSELTGHLKAETAKGCTVYRVRSACGCKPNLKHPEMYPCANMRNGVLVIENDKVTALFVMCKNCSKQQKE